MSQTLPSAPGARPTRSRGEAPAAGARQIAVIGRGRLGTTLARELARAGHRVRGPLGRDYAATDVAGAEIALLCVPDREIALAAAQWRRRRGPGAVAAIGHCSGASGLAPLQAPGGDGEPLFSLHPLMTFATGDETAHWSGAAAAVAGSSPGARAIAVGLAEDLGLTPIAIGDEDRAAYHASASIASNFLVALECAAAELAATCGLEREMLVPLVRASVENWAQRGEAALTGPIVRGDEETVARQREAVAERAPALLDLFDALAAVTRAVAARDGSPSSMRGLAA